MHRLHTPNVTEPRSCIAPHASIYRKIKQELEFRRANDNAIIFVDNLVEITGFDFPYLFVVGCIENVNHKSSFLDSVAYAMVKVNG